MPPSPRTARTQAGRRDSPGRRRATFPCGRTTRRISRSAPRPIREEHHCHLAEHRVELAIANGSWATSPWRHSMSGRTRARHGQHRLVEIDADDATIRSDDVRRRARHDAGAARDVQHRITRLHGRDLGESWRPLGEERRDELRLVELSRLDGDLERLVAAVVRGSGGSLGRSWSCPNGATSSGVEHRAADPFPSVSALCSGSVQVLSGASSRWRRSR